MWANHGEFTDKEYTGRKRRRRIWKRAVAALSCAVVFSTTYMLILPAITEEQTTYCGHEEHKHDAACYEKQLICELDDQTPHVHSDACYKEEQVLICGEEENAGHTHGADCVRKDSVLICSEEHEHTDACYQTEDTYVCGLAEGEGAHTHGPECYQTQKTLICGQSEGETHVHADACYEEVLTCHKEEHEHSLACFSDPNADVEMQDAWERTMADVQLTGAWADDVIAIAKSQLGYEESTKNYTVTDAGKIKGYSRYGAWYGDPYGDWNAMFAAFCLHYAGMPDYPADADCAVWVGILSTEPYGYFRTKETYSGKSGDLVFTDQDRNGAADRVGIAMNIADDGTIQVIEGDVSGSVQYRSYSADTSEIVGFGLLPSRTSDITNQEDNDAVLTSTPAVFASSPDDSGYSSRYSGIASDYSAANKWQITSQLYENVKSGSGTYAYSSENGVRIQKAAIPSDTENEFQIYLNAEPQMSWQEFFESCDHYATHNKASSFNPNSGVTKMYSEDEYLEAGKPSKWYPVHVNYKLTSTLSISLVRYLDFSQIQNVKNGSYCFVNKKFATTVDGEGFARGIDWRGLTSSGMTLDIDCSNLYAKMTFAEDSVKPTQVADPMGHNILFAGVQSYDGGSYAAPNAGNGNTLTWNLPEVSYKNREYTTATVNGKETAYYPNTYQMRYSISLDVNADDFYSCAPVDASPADSIYPTNGETTLNYRIGAENNTTDFPIPAVRGLLYNITFDKQSDTGKSLAGAVFSLFETDGVTPVTKPDGTAYTITTAAGETSRLTDLPFGTYVLKEIVPPKHYSAGSSSTWTIRLCYTEDQQMWTLQTDGNNLRYAGNDQNGQWIIVNTRNEYTYQLKVIKTDDSGSEYLQDVSFTVTNPAGGGLLSGVTDENGCITFDAIFRPGIEYVLTETAAPDGYQMLPADIRFVVRDNRENDTQTVEVLNKDELNGLVDTTLSDDGGVTMLVIHVKNQAGYVLPETGGPGTTLFTLCGLALMAMVGALMYRYHVRLRRERRDEQS